MVLPEWLTRKVMIIAALAVIVLSAAAFTAMQDEAVSIEPVLEIVPALEPEPVQEPVQEQAQELEPAPEPTPEIEPVIEVEPEPEPAPEPVIIEPIEIVPSPVVEIPEPPPEVPSVPDEIPKPPEQEIQEKVDRFDAQPGTPVPKKGAAAGTISRIHSADMMEINGVLLKLSGVRSPNQDGVEFDLWRQALMRICPVGSLALYDNPNRSPDNQGRISTNVWCYGYPSVPPQASANEVMKEADYTIIGRGCSAPHDARLLGCTR